MVAGGLLAATAKLTRLERAVVGGNGVRLAEVATDAVEEVVRSHCDPRTRPIALTIRFEENVEWCRGAAVVGVLCSVA